ncbi:RNA polymerase sigma factor [Planotetraspora mira]|uniref:RNA polymerase sigma factor 70 region 4 type 2 domain-containing protein n=1 Tax=Planotetraspora mira TaxID=58121 RepID=A0A8J3TYM7_9ACTN|nr:hypothetical protein [Planotetraspora mira]GII29580.1 hypothetical protein Pmi06nite_30220 [Planotetraspora mira]
MNVPPGARPFPSSPTRAAARDLPGFDAFVADHSPALARTAFLLTGDGTAARRLVVAAVTKVGNRWNTLRWSSPARAALRELFGAYLTRPPQAPPIVNRPSSGDAAREGAGLHAGPQGPDGRILTLQVSEAMRVLTPRRRALIVARFHEGLPVEHAAVLCQMDVRTAWTEIAAALSELKGRLPALAAASDAAPAPGTAPTSGTAPASGPTPASDTAPAPDEAAVSAAPDTSGPPARRDEGETPEPQDPRPEAPAAAPSTAWTPPPPQSTSWTAPEAHSTSWAPPEPQSAPASPAPSWAPQRPLSSPHGTPLNPSPAATPEARPYSTPHPAPSVTPFRGPQAAEDPAHEALRRHLALLAAESPAVDVPGVTGEILRTARRRRTRRRIRATIAGVAAAGLVGVGVIAGMSALIGGIQDGARRADPGLQALGDGGDPQDQQAQDVPRVLDYSIPNPFRYAYRPYCDPDDSESADYGDCRSWRVVSTGFDEWRIPDADTRSDRTLFAMSADGARLAYYDTSADAVVMVSRDDTTPELTDLISDVDKVDFDTELDFSPAGRWLAVGYGQGEGAPRPRLHDFTTNRSWSLPRYLNLLAVSDDGTVTATMTGDVLNEPGHVHTTTLVRMRPDGHVLSRMRVEPELFDSGGALSGDGKVLAVAVEPAHPSGYGQNRVVTLDARTGKVRTLTEAALPKYSYIDEIQGWVNDREVLVDVSDDDDGYYTYIVDVSTGAAREVTGTESYDAVEVWAAGTLG